MALGSSLRGRRARFHTIASWLGGFGLLALCACEPRQGAGEPPRASQALVAEASGGALARPRSASVAASFLVRADDGTVLLRSRDGEASRVVGRAMSWLFDDAHQLFWFVDEGRLSVVDLRTLEAAVTLAEGLPSAPQIGVQWPAGDPARFLQPRGPCEPGEVVQLDVAEPSLHLVGEDRRLPFVDGGRRWLSAQVARAARAAGAMGGFDGGFDPSSARVELPASVAACDDEQRCGLSAALGPQGHRLVLVRDRMGADCWHRGCLLYDPATQRFASPPVVEDEATGALSATGGPPRWSSAEAARVGVCGPYHLDASQTHILVRRYSCRWGVTCADLGGEVLGWVEPGPVVGEPG